MMHVSPQDESAMAPDQLGGTRQRPVADNDVTDNNLNGNENDNGANNRHSANDLLMTVEEGDANQQLEQSSQIDEPASHNTSTSSNMTTLSSGVGQSMVATTTTTPAQSPSIDQLSSGGAGATEPSPQLHLASIHSLHPQLDLKLNTRFMLMPSNDQIRELQTVLRDKATNRGNFKFYADRLIRLVVEEGLNQLPIEKADVNTPTGNVFHGIRYLKGNCGVSIVRSGESMEQGLRDCCRSIRIGKILIESDENGQARVLYAKFPRDIATRKILLLYPIMSTGLPVIESVKVLLNHGVREENLILLNLFSSPRAAKIINSSFPRMFALTSDINPVCPNHFGQRYFGTD